ncbi:MAG: thiamine-monophosphate kinase [Actinomycetota bacterium]|nr:thiamine-monophosphate kinase [Actinomycetota bacterium]
MDEFELIATLTAGLPRPDFVRVGLGDDAAVVEVSAPQVVACTDMVVEGRHFRRAWSSAEDIGHRVAAANLADIVAMGAMPRALLVSIAIPAETETGWAADLIDGIQAEAEIVGAAVVGGDTNSTEGPIVVCATALGDLQGRSAIQRGGARPGDQVALVGRQGWAAAGLTVLSRGFRSPRLLVEALRRPEVPYEAGIRAAESGATAMIDVSDGLLADLGHIATASGVAIDLHTDLLPVDEPLRDTAIAFTMDPLKWVLTGGEDHSLAATFPADAQLPEGFRRIGVVTSGEPTVTVDGAEQRGARGWVHFGP